MVGGFLKDGVVVARSKEKGARSGLQDLKNGARAQQYDSHFCFLLATTQHTSWLTSICQHLPWQANEDEKILS